MKTCKCCKKEREDSDFNANSNKSGGRQSWCRECTTAYSRRWYEANREKHRAYVNEKRPRKIHTCKHCGRGEPEAIFYIKKDGNRYYKRFICLDCDVEYRKKYPRKEDANARENKRKSAKQKISRTLPSERHRHILTSSRKADKRTGRENDLDREFIRAQISEGCLYCGDMGSQMTLDRVDNSLGHLKSNVVPACIRCNYFRRDMPFDAWMLMVPAMRTARERGLLDGWHSGTNKSKPKVLSMEDVAMATEL